MPEQIQSFELKEQLEQNEEQFLLNIVRKLSGIEFNGGNDILKAEQTMHDFTDKSNLHSPIDFQISMQSMNAVVTLRVLRLPNLNKRRLEVSYSLPGRMHPDQVMHFVNDCLDFNPAVATSVTEFDYSFGKGEPHISPQPDYPPSMPSGGFFNYAGRRIMFTGSYANLLLFMDTETGEKLSLDNAAFTRMAESGEIFPSSSPVSQMRNETQARSRSMIP